MTTHQFPPRSQPGSMTANAQHGVAPADGLQGTEAVAIAHELNNVLMAILGFAELAAEDARAANVDSENADQVIAATHRAIEIAARLSLIVRR
jgi:signal transduction histidine kinase